MSFILTPFLNTTAECTPNRWELTEYFWGSSELPEKCLQSIFTGIMQRIEENTKPINSTIKAEIWREVSEYPLKYLQNFFLTEICTKIFGFISDTDTKEMLGEIKETGLVSFVHSGYVLFLKQLYESQIIDSVVNKAMFMSDNLVLNIFQTIKEKGI